MLTKIVHVTITSSIPRNSKRFLFIILCLLCLIESSHSQLSNRALIDSLRTYRFYRIDVDPNVSDSLSIRQGIKWKIDFLKQGKVSGFPVEGLNVYESEKTFDAAFFKLFHADYLIAQGANATLAFDHYTEALDIGKTRQDSLIICAVLRRMSDFLNEKSKDPQALEEAIEAYEAYAFDDFERLLAKLYRVRSRSNMDLKPYLKDFEAIVRQAEAAQNYFVLAYTYKLLGVKHDVYANELQQKGVSYNNYEKAQTYYDKSLGYYTYFGPSDYVKKRSIGLQINKGIVYYFQRKYDSAAYFLRKAQASTQESDYGNKVLFLLWYSRVLAATGKYDSAYYYKSQETRLRRGNFQSEMDLGVAEINRKFKVEEKEKENVEKQRKILEQEKQLLLERESKTRSRTIAYVLGITLVLGLVISILLYRDSQRKRLLAVQDKNIQSEKVTNLLKEQELVALSAMIKGQETERKRIAEDLHDRLGSTLSAVKMHMEVLSEDNPKFDRINRIVDKAVDDTREIAHNMLSGVLTNFGLLAALQDLKETVESAEQIRMKLSSIQFDERLESETELHIYRIIQELIGNTLKHSKASLVKLELRKVRDQGLTISYEDNGVGFDPETVTEGMGLKNIKNRVDKIKGHLQMSAAPAKGLTVCIELGKIE